MGQDTGMVQRESMTPKRIFDKDPLTPCECGRKEVVSKMETINGVRMCRVCYEKHNRGKGV